MGQDEGIENENIPDNKGTPPPSYEDTVEMKKIEKNNWLSSKEKKTSKSSLDKEGKDKKEEDGEDEKEKEPEIPPVGPIELFRFADKLDAFLIIFGLLISASMGAAMPVLCILFGDALQAFVDNDVWDKIQSNQTVLPPGFNDTIIGEAPEPLMTVIGRFGWGMIGLALIIWALAWVFVSCLNYAAARQVFKIRCRFFQAVLKQDIAWYDTSTANDFASRMTEDLNKLQEGIGEKIGMMTFFTSTFICSIITAFVYGWDLTLIIMTMIPFMIIFGGMAAKVQSSFAEKEMAAYGKAGSIAEEALSAIRTVVAFGGQQKEVDRYKENLVPAKKSGILRGMLTGVSGGLLFGIMYMVYALGFWYGIKVIMDDLESEECQACGLDLECIAGCSRYSADSLLVVFFSVLIGGFQIGQSAPYAEAFATAQSAAGKIYSIIDRVPDIDSSSKEGKKPSKLEGVIKFENIFFNYPSRKDVKILQGLDIEIPKGKTVALVGSSGCGKSTCIQLVQRFYDPDTGRVLVDDNDIKDLNIGWLRDHIGVVGQEPVLFDLTIKENIRLGKQDASDAEIEKACKEANAYNFIMTLPKKYDTMVGEGGTQLSGGQKQRIAIARALIRNPQILLLDEATSALDTESEKVVQAALDNAREGRTTIVVAHRLSTIRTADLIIGLQDGQVKEMGTHNELMSNKDLYYNLVMRQMASKEEEAKEPEKLYPELHETGQIDPQKLDRSISSRSSKKVKTARQESVMVDDSENKTDDDEDLPKIQMMRILKRNSPEWFYIALGVLASAGMGGVMPLFGIVFGDMLGALSKEPDEARADSVKFALYFVALGFFAFLTQFIQGLMFSISGENLTSRMRADAFSAMLQQEMGWYDKKENNTGALCARLSGDCSKVQGATGARVGTIMQGVAGILIAIVIGLVYNWKLGLVCSIFLPLTIIAVIMEQRIIIGADSIEKVAFEDSAKLAVEAITNIRTVAGLRVEEKYIDMYKDLLSVPLQQNKKRSHMRGILFGFSQGIQYFSWGVSLWFGGYLVDIGEAEYTEVFTVQNAIIGGAGMIGYAFAFVSDFNKAMVAAARVFHLLDRKPLIDANPSTGLKMNDVNGNVDVKDAEFHYPTRPNIKVLKRLQLSIKKGESIALVGESGCGKSTVIQLIQRLYDLESGNLNIEQQNIEALNLPWFRSKLGLVSQEPVLFDRTISDNIKYGDNEREVSMEEVMDAARRANIHNFVTSLPSGYDTKVGSKGTQLSGGQKQRVAIARALVRNPRILLLDEATSALDTESEKIVQDALDAAQVGRTSITIAHRLSTIKNVDQIYIIAGGQVVENGSHEELLKKQGHYYRLWNNSVH